MAVKPTGNSTVSPTMAGILNKLEKVKKNGAGNMACCPAHNDKNPSLSVTEGKDGVILLKCFVGCRTESIVEAMGLEMKDLFPHQDAPAQEKPQPKRKSRKEISRKHWDITDNTGVLIATHHRIDYSDNKKKMWWVKDGKNDLDGYGVENLPLYGLKWAIEEPDDSERPWIVGEGEAAIDALHQAEYVALGTVTGAEGCPSEDSLIPLLSRKVYLWPDNDDVGRKHMNMVAARLNEMGVETYFICWPDAPLKGDAVDYLAQGGNVDDLLATAKKWEPQSSPPAPTSTISSDQITTGLTPDTVRQICNRGFLRSYIDWASGYTDAPLAFHLAAGLSLLATTMGNRYSTNAWGRSLYPNLWIAIISPSGFYRKTTCIRLAMRILKPELGGLVLPTEWSREKLVTELAKNPAGLFEWDEFGFALSAMSRDYNAGTKEMLTKLFDSADSHSRATGQGQTGTIEKPAPSILAGSTIEWLQDKVKAGDLRGGFMSRILFVPGVIKEPEKDFDTALRPEIEKELSDFLVKLSRSKGIVMDFASVKSQIRDWVRVHEQQAEHNIHPDLLGFISRGETYLLKLCMVLAASLNNSNPRITEEVLNKAILLLDVIKQGVVDTFSDLAIPYGGKELQRVREMLKRNCPMTKSKALKNSHLPAKQFDPLLDTLTQTGEVEMIEEEGQGQNKKILHWKG